MKTVRIAVVVLATIQLLGPLAAAGAEDARIPNRPLVTDPAGDANGTDAADQSTQVSVAAADILAAWITADEKNVNIHWLLAASPLGEGIDLVLRAVDKDNPIEVGRRLAGRCLWFTAEFPNQDSSYDPYGYFHDNCTTPGPYEPVLDSGQISLPLKVSLDVFEDGRAIVTATAARKGSPLLRSGRVLDSVDAQSALFRIYASGRAVWGRAAPLDTTSVGRDYRLP